MPHNRPDWSGPRPGPQFFRAEDAEVGKSTFLDDVEQVEKPQAEGDIGVDEIDIYGEEDDKPIFLGMDVRYVNNMEVNGYSKIVVTSEDIGAVHTVLKEKSYDSNKIVGLLQNGQMVK